MQKIPSRILLRIFYFQKFNVLTLPEKSDALIKELAKNKNLKLKTKEVYVNPSFYRFMLGEKAQIKSGTFIL